MVEVGGEVGIENGLMNGGWERRDESGVYIYAPPCTTSLRSFPQGFLDSALPLQLRYGENTVLSAKSARVLTSER